MPCGSQLLRRVQLPPNHTQIWGTYRNLPAAHPKPPAYSFDMSFYMPLDSPFKIPSDTSFDTSLAPSFDVPYESVLGASLDVSFNASFDMSLNVLFDASFSAGPLALPDFDHVSFGPAWLPAKLERMLSLINSNVSTIVDQPGDRRPIISWEGGTELRFFDSIHSMYLRWLILLYSRTS
jgi:hypothetical protein